MSEIEIKEELEKLEQDFCRTCLSVGRKLFSMRQFSNILKRIISEFEFHTEEYIAQMLICWECRAVLQNIVRFQYKVQRVSEILQLSQNFLYGTLSNLTTVIINDAYAHTIYVNDHTDKISKTDNMKNINESNLGGDDEFSNDSFNNTEENFKFIDVEIPENNETNDNIEIKTDLDGKNDNSESVEVKKVIKNNRWAIKRAIQNKKPKFKILNSEDLKFAFRKVYLKTEILYTSAESERKCEYFKSMTYKCESCTKGFKNEYLLTKHDTKHHKQKLGCYTCDICQTKFSEKRHLSAHIRKHYVKYECKLCDFRCHRKKAWCIHVESYHRRVFQCLKCELIFGSRREFFKHFKEWHEKFICDYCGISFKMRYCIKDHIRKQHSPFECKLCSKRFSRYNGLWLHNKIVHSVNVTPAHAAYCVECDKRYPDVYRYRWHLANSAKHKPPKKIKVPCPGCDKVFSKKIYMKDHYNLVHLKHYKYRCEQCDKNFIRNADLVNHRRRIHEGILPPKNKICYMCGRGFTTNKILTNHMRTHTGERPYCCTQCPARFAQNTALVGHMRALHKTIQTQTINENHREK